MLSFEEFFPVEFPEKTKVKFNMNAGNVDYPAWDYLRDDAIEWNNMNAHKTIQANNNLNRADYLLAFAQYYPYGCDYYIFGGMYKVEKIIPEVFDMVGYKLTLMPNFDDYRKRLIIKLAHPIGRDIYNKPYNAVQRDFNPKYMNLHHLQNLVLFQGTTMFF